MIWRRNKSLNRILEIMSMSKQLLRSYFQYWYLFLIAFDPVLGSCLLYLYLATPQYRITSAILLKNEESQIQFKNLRAWGIKSFHYQAKYR